VFAYPAKTQVRRLSVPAENQKADPYEIKGLPLKLQNPVVYAQQLACFSMNPNFY
jgi:hypothetical protein